MATLHKVYQLKLINALTNIN